MKDLKHELLDAVLRGDYTPKSVWTDYYKKWSDTEQWRFDLMLIGIMMHEKNEGRQRSTAQLNAESCYKYLFQKRCMVEDDASAALPSELDTEDFRTVLGRAVGAGLCHRSDGGYHWDATKKSLAYFADKAALFLGISRVIVDGQPKADVKPFEALFGVKNLKQCKADWTQTGTLPKHYKDIDALFS